MTFATGLRKALELRQSDLVSELRRGDSLEDVLNKHLLTVESMSDREILTSVLILSPDGKRLTHGAAPSLPQPYREAIDGSEIGPSAGHAVPPRTLASQSMSPTSRQTPGGPPTATLPSRTGFERAGRLPSGIPAERLWAPLRSITAV